MPDSTPTTTSAPAAAPDQTPLDLLRADIDLLMSRDAQGVPGWKRLDAWMHVGAQGAALALLVYGMTHDNNTALIVGGSLMGADRGVQAIATAVASRALRPGTSTASGPPTVAKKPAARSAS